MGLKGLLEFRTGGLFDASSLFRMGDATDAA
jgi:hypothetical protein